MLERIERFLVFCVFRTSFRRWFVMVSILAGKRSFMVSVVGFVLWFPSWQGTFFDGFRRWCFYGFRLLQDRGFLSDGNQNKTKKDIRAFA